MTKGCPFTGFGSCKKDQCLFFFIDGNKNPNCMIPSTWENTMTHSAHLAWLGVLLAKHGVSVPASPVFGFLKQSPECLTDFQETLDQAQGELAALRNLLGVL